MAQHKDVDAVTGTETTGHEWDGIKELNTPLPRWWLYTLYATIIWSVGYVIAMPAIPYISGYTKGMLEHSQRANVSAEIAAVQAARATAGEQLANASLEQVRADADLYSFAIAGGKSAFAVNCAQCHGTGGGGAKGYPNLVDDEWLWGGSVDEILYTISYGIRSGHDQARQNQMPAFGRDDILTPAQINQLVAYVRAISGQGGEVTEAAKQLFADNCVACHGENGQGNKELGAPNLTDGIWLYGGDVASIHATITNSRNGVMPNWANRLEPVTLKQLAIYVHSLGGGE